MATNYWINDTSGVWSDPSNWSLGAAPNYSIDVIFNSEHIGKCTIPSAVDVQISTLTISDGFPSESLEILATYMRVRPSALSGSAIDIYDGFIINHNPTSTGQWKIYTNGLPTSGSMTISKLHFVDYPFKDILVQPAYFGAYDNYRITIEKLINCGLQSYDDGIAKTVYFDYLDSGPYSTGVRGFSFQQDGAVHLVVNFGASEIETCQFAVTGPLEFNAPNLTKIKIINNNSGNNGYGPYLWLGNIFDQVGTPIYNVGRVNIEFEMLYPEISEGFGNLWINFDFIDVLTINTTSNVLYTQEYVSTIIRCSGGITYKSGTIINYYDGNLEPPKFKITEDDAVVTLSADGEFGIRSDSKILRIQTGSNTLTIPSYTSGDWDGCAFLPVNHDDKYNISACSNIKVNRFACMGMNNIGSTIDASDISNLDLGNNTRG